MLVACLVFASDLKVGPIDTHNLDYIKIVSLVSSALFLFIATKIYSLKDKVSSGMIFSLTTGILGLAILALSLITWNTGSIKTYDQYSTILLLVSLINLIAFVVAAKKKM